MIGRLIVQLVVQLVLLLFSTTESLIFYSLGKMIPNSTTTALHVGDLHPDVTEVMLEEMLNAAGPVHSIHLCRDRKTGSSRGCAYVNFLYRADGNRVQTIKKTGERCSLHCFCILIPVYSLLKDTCLICFILLLCFMDKVKYVPLQDTK